MNIIGLGITEVSTAAQFKLGTIAGDIGAAGPQKLYKYIQYDDGAVSAEGVAGEACYYLTGDVTATVATSDVSASTAIGCGILQAAMANGSYGWVQIKGLATMSIALTAGADGNALTGTGAGDGTLDVALAVTNCIVATAVDASASIILCDFPY